ncbi:serine/threonine protein kinase [Woeseia oceani]|uniref:Serine/threonine protein kinase n=1 Tax=Woeseia oceani TaxID=1548547 RepID=A0A193LBS8_9GAMM|nr:serine/threonine protein kinase [Woeseia oceani]ANO49854.1 serine/threonine protein kinase [Woeseia oceani]
MRTKLALTAVVASIVAAGCGSGDINIDPVTSVTNSNNTTNTGGNSGTTNPCASYQNTGGQSIQGTYDGTHCTYSPSFVDAGNNLMVDLTLADLPNDGAHLFEGSLFVGESHDNDADLAAAGIAEGGDGPVLTVEAGATLALQSSASFMIINRGSQLFAVGRADAPITFTSLSDINGTVGPEDVQQWGGMVINGFGITNKCAYTGSVATNDLATSDCHVDAEGAAGLDESQYGGDNNDDSSGRMEYVVVKHTGATVGNGDELNGITFGGVGRNTIVNNLQVYSTFDDGIEMFGGAVNFNNFVGMYVRDDAIDIDEGYSGTITNALVIQSETDGNHCIEADGIGGFDDLLPAEVEAMISQGINSRFVINNLTCIISPNGAATATHDPGAGWRLREGLFAEINDSLLIGSMPANDQVSSNDNYCLRIDNRTQQAALDGDLTLNSVVFACAEATRGQTFADGTTTERSFAEAGGNIFATIANNTSVDPTAMNDAGLQLLEGTQPIYSIGYTTMQVDGAAPAGAPQSGTFIGGLSLSETDWTMGWTFGLHPDNRSQALWFE